MTITPVNDVTAEPVASALMTRQVLVAHADWTLDELSSFFDRNSISGAPVEDGRKIVGLVSVTDLARRWQEPESAVGAGDIVRRLLAAGIDSSDLGRFRVEASSTTRVREVMTPVVFSVGEDATATEIAEVMTRGHIHRVLVMRGEKMVGIVTSMDMLRLLTGAIPLATTATSALGEGCAT